MKVYFKYRNNIRTTWDDVQQVPAIGEKVNLPGTGGPRFDGVWKVMDVTWLGSPRENIFPTRCNAAELMVEPFGVRA